MNAFSSMITFPGYHRVQCMNLGGWQSYGHGDRNYYIYSDYYKARTAVNLLESVISTPVVSVENDNESNNYLLIIPKHR